MYGATVSTEVVIDEHIGLWNCQDRSVIWPTKKQFSQIERQSSFHLES